MNTGDSKGEGCWLTLHPPFTTLHTLPLHLHATPYTTFKLSYFTCRLFIGGRKKGNLEKDGKREKDEKRMEKDEDEERIGKKDERRKRVKGCEGWVKG